MLKYEIESTEGLDESIAKLYQKSDDGKFRLAVDGLEDTSALKRARDHEKEQLKRTAEDRDAYKTKLQELEQTLENERNEKLKKAGKWEEIQESYNKKLEEVQSKSLETIEKLKSKFKEHQLESIVDTIGKDDSSKKKLRKLIKDQVDLVYEDGEFREVYLNEDGKPSELTKIGFIEQISKTDYLSDLIIGSRGSGGGATGSGDGGGATSSKKPNEMSEQERIRLKQESPDKFQATFGRRSA